MASGYLLLGARLQPNALGINGWLHKLDDIIAG
jgi:hypothetical protein